MGFLRFPISAIALVSLGLGLKKVPAHGLKVRHLSVVKETLLGGFQGRRMLIDTGPHSEESSKPYADSASIESMPSYSATVIKITSVEPSRF